MSRPPAIARFSVRSSNAEDVNMIRRTRFSMTLQRSMYLSALSAPASSCALRFSNVSKKYEYAVV